MTRVAIAGITGFVGKSLALALAQRHELVGIVRRTALSMPAALEQAELRACDLFSAEEAELALRGAEVAVYLLHSMMPAARGTHASFEDLDLLLADNFARACAANGVRRIVYVGGLIPPERTLSRHLESRLEVERALAAHGVPVVALRAGLVVGRQGSSFQILEKLVRRLPAMVCPAWTETPCQPIALEDLVAAIQGAVEAPDPLPAAIDVAGPEVLTYREMLERTAARLGKRPLLAKFPLFTPRLSRLWVTLVTGAAKDLVAPLVESLAHPMVAHHRPDDPSWARGALSFDQALSGALAPGSSAQEVVVRAARVRARSEQPAGVLLLDRLPLPPGVDASWVAGEYLRWAPRAMRELVRTRNRASGGVDLVSALWPRPLLSFAPGEADESRAVLRVTGGALSDARSGSEARLEFRVLPGSDCLLVAVQDFVPRLWWPLYEVTQRRAHDAIMRAFGRHLASIPSPRAARTAGVAYELGAPGPPAG